jgi:hypothetical protein
LETNHEGGRKSDKLAKALADGQLWRAKEILSGRIASGPFSPDTYEQFGLLLLRMGDDLQAGKYLFLCGRRQPEYQRSIDLFFRRYSRAGWQSLLAALPTAARRCSWSDLPGNVRDELVAAGVPPRPGREVLRTTLQRHPALNRGWGGCLLVVLVVISLGLLLAAVVAYFHEV